MSGIAAQCTAHSAGALITTVCAGSPHEHHVARMSTLTDYTVTSAPGAAAAITDAPAAADAKNVLPIEGAASAHDDEEQEGDEHDE
eukprot:gene42284-14492_t